MTLCIVVRKEEQTRDGVNMVNSGDKSFHIVGTIHLATTTMPSNFYCTTTTYLIALKLSIEL